MKHTIEGKEVNIDWEQVDLVDNHGSGCKEWSVSGEDENGITYFGSATYQDDELIEVNDIELE